MSRAKNSIGCDIFPRLRGAKPRRTSSVARLDGTSFFPEKEGRNDLAKSRRSEKDSIART